MNLVSCEKTIRKHVTGCRAESCAIVAAWRGVAKGAATGVRAFGGGA